MKVVFMGTPDFAADSLKALIEAGHDVELVVTQPDKAQKRSSAPVMSPVKELALLHGIPVFQPEKIRQSDIMERLNSIKPDVIAVVAFGQLLPKEVLEAARYGCINVHASLLPKYRGAAPIQWAVINGDEETGVVTMYMDETLDTGDVLLTQKCRLSERETGGSLFDRLSGMGAELLVRTLEGLKAGTIVPVKQTGESSYAKKLDKSMAKLSFDNTPKTLDCLVRGLNPWPCAYTTLNGKTLKIWDCVVDNEAPKDTVPGVVYKTDKSGIHVGCKDGGVIITELQLEGKKRMDAKSFLLGCNVLPGTVLGE